MESIMRNRGTSLRLVFPRDRYYLDMLPANKCSCVKTVELVYGALGFLDFENDASWFPQMMTTIATKLENLTHLTLSNEGQCPTLPLRPIVQLLERRADVLQFLDTDNALPSFWGTKEDTTSLLRHLSRATKLKVLKMGRSLDQVWRSDRNRTYTLSRKMLEAVGELSSLQKVKVVAPGHNQNNFFAEALRKLCQNEGKPLALEIEHPSELQLPGALPLQNPRVKKLIISRPRNIGKCIDRLVEGVTANKNLQELRIREGWHKEGHMLNLAAVVGLLSGLVGSQSLHTLDLTIHLQEGENFDETLAERLSKAIQRNHSLKRLQLAYTNKCSGAYVKFLAHILLGLASNCCIQDVQLMASFFQRENHKDLAVSNSSELTKLLATTYGKEISRAIVDSKKKLVASLRKKENTSLRKLELLNGYNWMVGYSWGKAMPFFSYAEEFWCFRHRPLLDQPENKLAWIDALIDSNGAISDCFCLLIANPSVFFSSSPNPAQSGVRQKRTRMVMGQEEENQSKCQKTE